MRIVVALGGNALLKRGEPMTAETQRKNVRIAARALADLARDNTIIIAHGNGPQVGLLALQASAYQDVPAYPLDILGAESVGMIGYLVEQELANAMPAGSRLATLLTEVEVDGNDPAFRKPEKPIGPIYTEMDAERLRLSHQDWVLTEESAGKWRRVVPSPRPKRITQIAAVRILVDAGVIVICAGGGGIPVLRDENDKLSGIEAVIDKDRAAGLLAELLQADAILMLTDVDAVYENWGTSEQRAVRSATPDQLDAGGFAAGSMGPKVEVACKFAAQPGRIAGIGRMEDARKMLTGEAGTIVRLHS